MNRRKKKLRTILISSFIMASVIPVLILGLIIFSVTTKKIRTDIIEQNSIIANSIADKITYFVHTSEEDIYATAYLIEQSGRWIHAEKKLNFSNRFQRVLYLDTKGIIRHSWPYNPDLLEMDMSRMDFFRNMETTGDIYWSQVFMSPDTGEPSISLSIPSRDGGVVAFISLSKLFEYIERTKYREYLSLYVIDNNGIVIASNGSEDAAQRRNVADIPVLFKENHGTTKVYQYEGETQLGSVFYIPELEWYFLAQQPVSLAFSTNNLILTYFLSGIIIIILFLILSVAFIDRRIQPLHKMVAFMNAVGDSEYHIMEDESSLAELEQLRKSYNRMSNAIYVREENLKRLLEDKNTLLREVNHRVKNNLMMVSSLFSLQSDEIEDEYAREQMNDARRRIESMALVHSMLYRNKDLTVIPFNEYLEDLVMAVRDSYQISRIDIHLALEEGHLSLDKAIPAGLVVNELLTNIFKHAFSEESVSRIPKIEIAMSMKSGCIVTRITDNGTANVDIQNLAETGKLGVKLINLLTEQLNGVITFEYNGGTITELSFPSGE